MADDDIGIKWAYGVTTVESRSDLLRATLASLEAAGFDQPHIFIDGKHSTTYASATLRASPVKAYGNWLLSLMELYIRNPNAERYVIFQDDLLATRNLRQYLESFALPEKEYWSLYTSPSNQGIAPENKTGWYESNQLGRGAVALVFSRECVLTLLTNRKILNHCQDVSKGHRRIDGMVVDILKPLEWKEYVHNPSLVKHTGIASTIRPGREPKEGQETSFRGEEFDAMLFKEEQKKQRTKEESYDKRYGLQLPRFGWLPKISYVQIQTNSRCNADCLFCFAGETQVVTPEGDKSLEELALDGKSTLLVKAPEGNCGIWKECSVLSFGVQKLLTVVLGRGNSRKLIRVTPDHRWEMRRWKGQSLKLVKTTSQLKPGDYLSNLYASSLTNTHFPIRPSAFGIAQGFFFGDGGHPVADKKPGVLTFYAEKDKALLKYFQHNGIYHVKVNGGDFPQARDLPRFWKEAPRLDESKTFLLGWLAGYFAADGDITENGQMSINSADKWRLEVVKAVCYQLGLGVCPISSRIREGFGEDRVIHRISINRWGLPESFFLIEEHKNRVIENKLTKKKNERRAEWKIICIMDQGETEEVFCAVVPETERFALADNLMTLNCPYSESEHVKNPGAMTDDTWHLILANLRPFSDTINRGKVCPYLMQEPLIDKTIFSKIADIYRCFPQTCVEISTNGAALTDEVVDRLFEVFKGRRHDIWVSHHGVDEATYTHIMKIDYYKATNNLLNLLKKSDGKFNIKIRGAGESKAVEKVFFTREDYKRYWADMFKKHDINQRKVSVDAFQFHDRAGTLHRTDRGANLLNKGKVRDIGPAHTPFHCSRIDEWLHFMWDGTIRICCMDYHAEVKLPNINTMSLLDYFHSEQYYDLVAKVSGRVESEEDFICKRCTSPGG